MNKPQKSHFKSTQAAAIAPDPSWKLLYTAGGISAILYIILALIVPWIMITVSKYDLSLGGKALLELISEHKTWWMILQGLVLETSIFLIITAAALYMALKQINKSLGMMGLLVLGTSQVLFMAYYPVLLGLTSLSNQYAAAAAAQKEVFMIAAEALIAQNSGFNPVYETLFGAGIMIFSLVMLKGVFHKIAAWIGLASFTAVLAAMFLFPVIGLGYFFWWIFPSVWFITVGWRLIKIGRRAGLEVSYDQKESK